jgi:arylsulfatase A-like enzyme
VVHKGNGEWVLTDPPPATVNIARGRRPNMYDNSLRVPTMVRWPGVLTPGTVVEETVSNLDWFPTFLAMAGVSPPQLLLRGRDFLPLLRVSTSLAGTTTSMPSTRCTTRSGRTCGPMAKMRELGDPVLWLVEPWTED